ncbi:MAG: zinc ribbon domain-containing protein [Clostridiales bacterium]|nr:zinc ribbon domain-containing protein [Clostridiales bacterium]
MFCPNCGNQNAEGVRFCAQCGTNLMPDVNAAPVQQQAQYTAPVAPVQSAAPITAMPQQKTNVLCVVGLITSLVSIVLLGTTSLISLILSIIGLITAGKKNEKGKGQAIAGIIISAVLLLTGVFAVIVGVNEYNNNRRRYDDPPRRTTEYEETTRRTTRETTEETTKETTEETTRETTRETTEETERTTPAETSESSSKSGLYLTSVGNDKTGKVPLTSGKWIEFREAGGHSSEVVEHQQAQDISTGSIIGLFVLNLDNDPEEVGKAQMAAMEKAGAQKITGARVKIGGYNAVQCYGTYPDGTILVCWYFRGDDGLLRKITVEFPSSNTKAFKMVEDGYKLDR